MIHRQPLSPARGRALTALVRCPESCSRTGAQSQVLSLTPWVASGESVEPRAPTHCHFRIGCCNWETASALVVRLACQALLTQAGTLGAARVRRHSRVVECSRGLSHCLEFHRRRALSGTYVLQTTPILYGGGGDNFGNCRTESADGALLTDGQPLCWAGIFMQLLCFRRRRQRLLGPTIAGSSVPSYRSRAPAETHFPVVLCRCR